MKRTTLFFEPLDVLQFRDHRPFDMGLHVNAASTFPKPSVFHGCLRTALLRLAGARFGGDGFGPMRPWASDLLGTPAAAGTLALRGPLFARFVEPEGQRTVEPLFHAPLGSIREKERDEVRWHAMAPWSPTARRFHGPSGRLVTHPMPWTIGEPMKGTPPLFTLAGARRFLATREGRIAMGDGDTVLHADVYDHETRVGIQRDDGMLLAEDRMFYRTSPFRMARDAGFAVDVELPGGEADALIAQLDGMVVPLGGKAHRACIRAFAGPLLPDDLAAEGAGARKLWLLTPLPLAAKLDGWPAGVACAATDRAVPIGGFDMHERAPKALRRALPAGTVLWLGGEDPRTVLASLAGETWEADRRAGYGVALAGQGAEDR